MNIRPLQDRVLVRRA
nr:GroES homolog {N-terminal} [Francisella tularensis, LVS, Peptide Partial, 15 aa] [Francisella tularensis]